MKTCHAPHRLDSGFTLLELMMTITVLGVLLGLGVPAFNDLIRNNRTAAQTNEFTTAIALARSEASRRGSPVSICASEDTSDTTGCAAATESNWANGWIVFSDTGATVGQLDPSETVIARRGAIADGLTLTSNNTGFVRFSANGAPTVNNVTFALQHSACTGNNRRAIDLNATGRLSIQKGAC